MAHCANCLRHLSESQSSMNCPCRPQFDALEAEVERLHSWDGLMSLLDEHYPEDIFPTGKDHESGDPGPRILSLIRRINEIRGKS